MADTQTLIKAFIKKFKAQVVVPWEGNAVQVDVGPTRLTITNSTRYILPGTEFLLRVKHLVQVLERDVWDVPSLKDAQLLEAHMTRTIPAGTFRPKEGRPKITSSSRSMKPSFLRNPSPRKSCSCGVHMMVANSSPFT